MKLRSLIHLVASPGQHFSSWTLCSYLGGGNGEVWLTENEAGEAGAIKLLKRVKQKSYVRFMDETNVIEQNFDIEGIIPILDKFVPQTIANAVPFYVMPLCEPSEKKLLRSIEEKWKQCCR